MSNMSSPERRSAIERLLKPRSIAIAGVSAGSSSLGGTVLANLERFGFPGPIHLIHPNRNEIAGRPCVPNTAALPDGVDCVVLAIPSGAVLEAVRGCAARGIGGVIIFSAGFAELGAEGRAVQEEIAAVARAAGMVIEGPNCLGMLDYVDGVPLTFSATEPHPLSGPGIGLVSQSGAMAAAVRAALHSRDLDVSYSISTGNEAANGVEDFVEWLLDDSNTRSITLVVEHFRSPRRFLQLARRARELGKPILLLHPGKSSEARHSAATHTGAMTGDYVMMRTAVEGAGVCVVDTLEELIAVAEIVLRCRVLPYGGAAVLGESGAFKALMIDYCAEIGLSLPQPTGEAAATLAKVAPGLIQPSNPLDLTAQPLVDPGIYAKTIVPLLSDPHCGSMVLNIILSSAQMAGLKMPPVVDVVRQFASERATVFAMLGEDTSIPRGYIDQIRAAGVPFFRSPERALRALAVLSRWKDREIAEVLSAPDSVGRLPAGTMPEYRAKQVLADAGFPVPRGVLARTLDDAIAAAKTIGFPVVLKAQAKELSHKSDVGGVALNIGDSAALQAAWHDLHANVGQAAPGVTLDGVLIEEMARKGVEFILGGRNDPDWGPVLMIGMGGVAAEALQDMRTLPAGSSERRIVEELGKLKSAALLGAFRGSPARDVTAVARAVRLLGNFLAGHPEIAEIDINPLVVYAEGEGVRPLDALVHIRSVD